MEATRLLLIGAAIGLISKLDRLIARPGELFDGQSRLRWGWLAVLLILAGAKAALVIYGIHTLVSIKVADSSMALALSGFVTIAYEQIWRLAHHKVARQASQAVDSLDELLPK